VVDGFGYWNWNARSSMPTNVFNATNIVAIGAGDSHNLVLECDGTVLAWGYGYTNVPAGLSNVTAIACGEYHSLALKRDGTVVGWGDNSWGQTNVPAGLSGVVAIAGGAYHSLALKSDGTVVGWGSNYSGETNAPADLSNVVAIAAGFFYSLALKSDGTVVAWGANTYGLTNVPAGLSNVIAIAAGQVGGAALAIVGSAPPAGQVPLANSSFGPRGFRVSLPTQSGRVYALEYQDALSNGTWTALPLAAGNGRTLTLTDPTAAGTQRFYRVRQW
jgi:alpha-tubulin suppressor-like RCC1 family protein